MNTSPKIDISAIIKNKNDDGKQIKDKKTIEKKESKIIKPEIKDKKIKSKTPHISISSIKTSQPNGKEKKEEKTVEKKEKLIEKQSNLEEDDKNIKTNLDTEIVGTKSKEELDNNIKKIEKDIDKKVNEETQKKFKLKDEVIDEKVNDEKEGNDLFGNYKSDFKEKTIIEKIKEKKKKIQRKLREPKTRIVLVLGLLIMTGSVIFGLFVLDPDNHSLDIYKTRISSNINNVKTTYIDKPWLDKTINIDSISFDIFTQEKWLSKTITYKYNDVVYETKDELETILKLEAKSIKDEIAKKEAEIARLEEKKRIKEAEDALIEKHKKEIEIIKNILLDKYK